MSDADLKIGTFFQFLTANSMTTGQAMVDKMDGYGKGENHQRDGILIKGEFFQFIEENWNSFQGININHKDINTFWDNIDLKRGKNEIGNGIKDYNALNATEVTNVNKQLIIYEELKEFMNTVSLPRLVEDYLGGQDGTFKNKVNLSLMEACQKYVKQSSNLSEDQVRVGIIELLRNEYPTSAMKSIADMFEKTSIDAFNESLPPGVQGNYWDDLEAVINKYIKDRANTDTFAYPAGLTQMIGEIQFIIKEYFKEAGITTSQGTTANAPTIDNTYSRAYLVDSSNSMSDLQSAIVENRFKEALENTMVSYDGENFNKTLFEKWPGLEEYVNQYKAMYMKTLTTFSSVKSTPAELLSDFLTGTWIEGASVKDRLNLHANAKAITEDWVFCSALFGNTATNEMGSYYTEFSSGKYNGAGSLNYGFEKDDAMALWKKIPSMGIIDRIQSMISSGEISNKGQMYDEIAKLIKENMMQYSEVLSINTLWKEYETVEEEQTTNPNLETLRKAAIDFCTAIVNRHNNACTTAVTKIFGGSYTTKINEMDEAQIKHAMAQLKAELDKIEDTSSDDHVYTIIDVENEIDEMDLGDDILKYAIEDVKGGWSNAVDNVLSFLKGSTKYVYDELIEKFPDFKTNITTARDTMYNYFEAAIDSITNIKDGYVSPHGTHSANGGSFSYTNEATGTTELETGSIMFDVNGSSDDDDYVDGDVLGIHIDKTGKDSFYIKINESNFKSKFKSFLG